MPKKCRVCKEAEVYPVCPSCARDMVYKVKDQRVHLINDAMRSVTEEADRVYDLDPTKGRGRGPKWLD